MQALIWLGLLGGSGCAPDAGNTSAGEPPPDATAAEAAATLDTDAARAAEAGSPRDAATGSAPGPVGLDASETRDAGGLSDAGNDAASAPPPLDAGSAEQRDATSPSAVFMPRFILGADVTITVEDEYYQATYTDQGRQKPLEQLLKDHGFNFIRIDTFVNPQAPGGYAVAKPEPFRDLAHTIALARRVKAIGLGLMLNLHYSDTWTNPGAHATPAAWNGLNLSALESKVYDYTRDAVSQLREAGAMPDIVSVGNEITNGMLWDLGRITNNSFVSLAALLKAGIRAVHDVHPDIKIQLHIEKCNNASTSQWWLDSVRAEGVRFDILAQSCYASAPNGVAGYQGTAAEWRTTFTALAARYPDLKFMIAEYSADQRAANDTMFELPGQRGLGTFNWDPTRSYDTHPNDPLFSTSGAWNRYVTIPAKLALYDQMAADYGLR
jgi:arabinogalactan endo-1,4-beta-galactosidase